MVEAAERAHALPRDSLFRLLSASHIQGLALPDIAPFLHPDYDPQEYANAIIEEPTGLTLAGTSASPSFTRPSPLGVQAAPYDGVQPRTPDGHARSNWLPRSGHVEGDLSVALGRLNLAIDDVDKLVRDEVTSNAPLLLSHTTTLLDLRPTLSMLLASLASLEEFQQKLVTRVSAPRQALEAHTRRLLRTRSSLALVKQAQQLVRLLRRLDTQMQSLGGASVGSSNERRGVDDKGRLQRLGEEEAEEDAAARQAIVAPGDDPLMDNDDEQAAGRGLSRCALTIAQINILMHTSPAGDSQAVPSSATGKQVTPQSDAASLLQLDFVQEITPMVDEARGRVTDLMEDMVVRGLRDLSPSMLSTSLQTAFNLGQLTELVRDLVTDLTDVVRDRVRSAFDMQTLTRELGSREPAALQPPSYRARRGDQVAGQQQRWVSALWTRLETLVIGEMGAICSKVYTLERVLSLKNDPESGANYLKLAMPQLGDRPSAIFWTTLGDAVEGQARRASSPFLLQSLETGYPRLLRLFQEFFAKISVYTGTVYTYATQSPETMIVLRSLSRFEDIHLSKSKKRMEAIVAPWSPRQVPGVKEALALVRAAADELDASQQDPLLQRAVGTIVVDWLERAVWRLDDLVLRDADAASLAGIGPSQLQNAAVTSAAYHLLSGLRQLTAQTPANVTSRVASLTAKLETLYDNELIEPLVGGAICKDVSEIIARMHYVDFGLDRDAVSGSGSAYMADLSERTWYVREQLLVHYQVPTRQWLLRIAQHALRQFVMHASLLRPLAEGGKLKLTADMTELEFSISQLLASARSDKASAAPVPNMADCGDDFKALRAFRQMLFADVLKMVPADALRNGLPVLAAAHHVVARSATIPLPHTARKWTAAEYVRWLGDNGGSAMEGQHLVRDVVETWRNDRSHDAHQADHALADCVGRFLDAAAAAQIGVQNAQTDSKPA